MLRKTFYWHGLSSLVPLRGKVTVNPCKVRLTDRLYSTMNHFSSSGSGLFEEDSTPVHSAINTYERFRSMPDTISTTIIVRVRCTCQDCVSVPWDKVSNSILFFPFLLYHPSPVPRCPVQNGQTSDFSYRNLILHISIAVNILVLFVVIKKHDYNHHRLPRPLYDHHQALSSPSLPHSERPLPSYTVTVFILTAVCYKKSSIVKQTMTPMMETFTNTQNPKNCSPATEFNTNPEIYTVPNHSVTCCLASSERLLLFLLLCSLLCSKKVPRKSSVFVGGQEMRRVLENVDEA